MSETSNKSDLVLERTLEVSPEQVWAAWTQPENLMAWFCPKPFQVVECEIDLRPGGRFMTVMQGPDGQRIGPLSGCYLEMVPNRKLVWTSALAPGYRPQDVADAPFVFTCVVEMAPHATGCHYTATAMHKDEASAEAHAKMGFHEGWGKALEQLVEHMKSQGQA